MDISIIIVSYNCKEVLMLTLSTVRRAIAGLDAEVIVVDNASTDGTVEHVRFMAPWVRLIPSEQNLGFSKANNIGLQMSKGRVILILNPDTVIPSCFFRTLVKHVDENAEQGAIGVRMVNGMGRYLGESKRGYTSLLTSIFKLTGIWKLAPNSSIINAYYIGGSKETDTCKAPILSGACMAFSHALYEKVGGFDDKYFMYCEDNDLSWRMETATTGNIYHGDLSIIHFKGQSTPRQVKYIGHFYKSMLRFASKYEYPKHNKIVNFITALGIRTAYCLALFKCIFLRKLEKGKKFVIPQKICLVTDSDKHAACFLLRSAQASEVKPITYIQSKTMDIAKFDAIVFDIDGDIETAIEFMRNNSRKAMFGFFNPDEKNALVFYNNRCHNILV